MLGFAVGRWGVGSLCGNYHKTIIQNLRSNTKANTKQSNDKTENRKKNRKAGRKKPRRLGRGGWEVSFILLYKLNQIPL